MMGVASTKLKFIEDQLSLAFSRHHRYSPELILWSVQLYFSYPDAFTMKRKSKMFPHQSHLQNLTSSLNFNGDNELANNHFTYLKQKSKRLQDHETIINLLLDEIYANPLVDYKGGNIVGISNNCDESVAAAATTVQTFIVSSVFSKNNDVAALVLVKNVTSSQLQKYTVKILDLLHGCGNIVLSMIADNDRLLYVMAI